MNILAIETSCDETSAAVLENGKVLSNIVASQIKIHEKTGGIVPEVASRAHAEKILAVIQEALSQAEGMLLSARRLTERKRGSRMAREARANEATRGLKDLTEDTDLIAVTIGPGLIGSLLIGVETAKTMAYLLSKPIIGINHLEGHIYANFISELSSSKNQNPNQIKFPAVCLTVSGGHTSLVLMKDVHSIKIIGETVDDAAGEAFDKVAKILGLGYPGGPAIEAAASKFKTQNPKLKIKFPRPMLKEKNFSFSGLKTAVLYEVMKLRKTGVEISPELKKQIAHEFQESIVETLVAKTLRAAEKYNVKSVLLSGGVAANRSLRGELEKESKKAGYEFHVPDFQYCTDNAAMIGKAADIILKKEKPRAWSKIEADANLSL